MTYSGVKGWVFDFVCSGNALSVFHEGLLLLKNATVNRNLSFDNVCVKKQVYVAYNNEFGVLEVKNGELVKYPLRPEVHEYTIVYEWEIQEAFLKYYNIKPHWINANYTWGNLDKTTGQWSGAVGLIQRDKADYAVFGFGGTYPRSKVTAFSPGIHFLPLHWLTRYPLKLSPTWNLLGLFTKDFKLQTNWKFFTFIK